VEWILRCLIEPLPCPERFGIPVCPDAATLRGACRRLYPRCADRPRARRRASAAPRACSVDISFAPQAPGSHEARLELNSADGGSIGVDLVGSPTLASSAARTAF